MFKRTSHWTNPQKHNFFLHLPTQDLLDPSQYCTPFYTHILQAVSCYQVFQTASICISTHPIRHTPVLPNSNSSHWSPYHYLVKKLNISLFNFLQPPITFSHWVPNILFNTLLSNTLSLFSSCTMTDQVSHPYKKFRVLYILTSISLNRKYQCTLPTQCSLNPNCTTQFPKF